MLRGCFAKASSLNKFSVSKSRQLKKTQSFVINIYIALLQNSISSSTNNFCDVSNKTQYISFFCALLAKRELQTDENALKMALKNVAQKIGKKVIKKKAEEMNEIFSEKKEFLVVKELPSCPHTPQDSCGATTRSNCFASG